MSTIETTTRRMVKRGEAYWPMKGFDIAAFFHVHNKCSAVYPLNSRDIGVVERNDGHTLALWLYMDGETVQAWQYTTHLPGRLLDNGTGTGGIKGDWETIAGDIAKTVTEWLNASPSPGPLAMERDTYMLAGRLASTLRRVGVEKDKDGTHYVVVHFDDEAETTAEVRVDYVLGGFYVDYVDGYGDSDVQAYADFDGLVDALREHGAGTRT